MAVLIGLADRRDWRWRMGAVDRNTMVDVSHADGRRTLCTLHVFFLMTSRMSGGYAQRRVFRDLRATGRAVGGPRGASRWTVTPAKNGGAA